MKKTAVFILLINVLFATVTVSAKPGDIAGKIYSTDIVAYIDEMAVPSFNIGGKTVVIAEELEPYGFEVIWNGDKRTLDVNTKAMPEIVPQHTPQKAAVSGRIVGDIYETDIVAYVNGMWVESYNIGGRTALVIEDMGSEDDEAKRMSRDGNPHRNMGYSVSLMRYKWNAEERTISLYCARPGSKIDTSYGAVTVENAAQTAYKYGAYAFYTEEDEVINRWVDIIMFDDEVYFSIDGLCGVFENMSARVDEKGFSVNIPTENIKSILHTNSSTIGVCTNMLITLSEKLLINGSVSQAETPDTILYRGTVYIGQNAINSALSKKVIAYKYELPEGCTEHIDNSLQSHVVVYINDNHINSHNTADGNCYISAKDLKEHGFSVEIAGDMCAILSPEKAVAMKQEIEYPETYWWGDIDTRYVLHPIYNGVYNVTVDGKEINDVYVDTALVFRSPCISVQDLAEIAGYRVDTSDPFKVKVYTEG